MCSCSGSKNFAWLLDLHKSVWVATVDVIWRLLFLQRLSHIARELSTSGAMTESQELFPAGGPGWDIFFETLFLGRNEGQTLVAAYDYATETSIDDGKSTFATGKYIFIHGGFSSQSC